MVFLKHFLIFLNPEQWGKVFRIWWMFFSDGLKPPTSDVTRGPCSINVGLRSCCRKFSSNIYWRSSGRGDYCKTTLATQKMPWCWWNPYNLVHSILRDTCTQPLNLGPQSSKTKNIENEKHSPEQRTNVKKNHPGYLFLRFWGKIKTEKPEELLIALGRRGQAVCLGLPLVLRLQVPGIQGTYRWIRGGGTGANNYIFLTFANSKDALFLISYMD